MAAGKYGAFTRANTGVACPIKSSLCALGNLSVSSRSISTIRDTGVGPAALACSNPTPRASIRPEIDAGAFAITAPFFMLRLVRSSATSCAPSAMSCKASDDFPLPDAPSIKTPRPLRATQVAWMVCGSSPSKSLSSLPGIHHTGRPTTNRAPSGSDVGSASVGRMFSAQITPPCASTICLEIARPRPELLPNWSSGRCE